MSESKLPCPAEDYKDVECPSKRKELLKMMRKVCLLYTSPSPRDS